MSAGPEDEPFAGVGSSRIQALQDFDYCRNELYDKISEEAVVPEIPMDTKEDLRDLADKTADSFAGLAVTLLLPSETDDTRDDRTTRAVDLERLWLDDEVGRSGILVGLTGCRRHFKPPTRREFTKLFKQLLHDESTEEALTDEAKALYQESIDMDLEGFFNHWEMSGSCRLIMPKLPSLEMSPNQERVLKSAGRQALEVSKIAAGVSLGILVSRKFGKNIE